MRPRVLWPIVGLLAMSGVALFLVLRPPAQTETQSPSPTRYVNEEFGFSLTHPAGWTASREETGTGADRIVNVTLGDAESGITAILMQEALEGILRHSLDIASEETVSINGIAAQRITANQSPSGEPVALLLFRRSGTLVVLNGRPDLVDAVGATFRYLEESSAT